MSPRLVTTITLAVALSALPAAAQRNELPKPLEKVGFDQRLGEQLPLDATFVDANDARVTLGDLLGSVRQSSYPCTTTARCCVA